MSLNNLRQLRLWHWQQRSMYRKLAAAERSIADISINVVVAGQHELKAQEYDAYASLHVGAVQLLNDTPECQGTTAEQDADDETR